MAEKVSTIRTIELTHEDGTLEKVNVDLRLNLKKITAISRDYPDANTFATMAISADEMQLDMIKMYKAVYVAYRMANMDEYYTFDDFADMYEFDMEEATGIFYSLLSREYRVKYLESISKATPKGSMKSKL